MFDKNSVAKSETEITDAFFKYAFKIVIGDNILNITPNNSMSKRQF